MIRLVTVFVAALSLVPLLSRAQGDQDAGGIAAGFFGSGGTTGTGGAFVGIYDTGSVRHIQFPGVFLELGTAGPTPATPVDGLFSINFQPTFNTDKHPSDPNHRHEFLFLNGGYSRFFLTGNGLDYGGGVNLRLKGGSRTDDWKAIRFEYREYYVLGWGRQPGFRIAYETGGGLD